MQDTDFWPDHEALPDDLTEFMDDSYLVKMLETDSIFSDESTLTFDENTDIHLAKELPNTHRKQLAEMFEPTGKMAIPQKRPRATLSKQNTVPNVNSTSKKQKTEGTDRASVQSREDQSCPSPPQSLFYHHPSIQFVTIPDTTFNQFRTQTIPLPVLSLPIPTVTAPILLLAPFPTSLSGYKLQVPPLPPEDNAIVPAVKSSSPAGTLSDTTSRFMSPPCNNEMTQSKESTAVQRSPVKFDMPQSVMKYIQMAKAHMHQICEEMEPRQNLTSHYVAVQVIQREMCRSGKKKNRCLNKEMAVMGDMDRQERLIKLTQVFENSNGAKPKRYILLLGKTGMGKTTLIRKLCQDWAKDCLPQFDFIFLLNSSALVTLGKSHYSLQTLLLDFFNIASCDSSDTEEVYAQVLAAPKRVLFIFDGFNVRDYELLFQEKDFTTLLDKDTKAKSSTARQLFSAILQRVVLPGSSLLISARPRGTACQLLRRLDSILEAIGFTAPNIETYVSKYFSDPDLRESALKCLEKCSYLCHLCWNPRLCRLVCLVLEHTQSSEGLPNSLTELCHKVVYLKIENDKSGSCTQAQNTSKAQVSKRTMRSTRRERKIKTKEIKTGEIYEKKLLSCLFSLAWEGVKSNTSILPRDVCSELKAFGIRKGLFLSYRGRARQSCCKVQIQQVQEKKENVLEEQRQNQHNMNLQENDGDDNSLLQWADPFLQSYLAGIHLSKARNVCPQNLLQNLFSQSAATGRQRPQGEAQELTQRFALGIMFLPRSELRRLHLDINSSRRALFTKHLTGLTLTNLCPDQFLELCHYIFEAGLLHDNNSDIGEARLATYLVENLPEVLTFRGIPLGPPDAYVVQKILERAENGSRAFSLDLEDTGIPISNLRSLVGLGSCSTYRACIADVIVLWQQLQQSGGRKSLQQYVKKFNINPLKIMHLHQIEHLSRLVKIHMNKRLLDCPAEPDVLLEKGVPAVNGLHKLEIDIGPERGPLAFLKLSEFLPSLCELQHLDLEGNNIGDKGAEQLAETFGSLCFLQILNLSQNYIGDNGVQKMVTRLTDLSKLRCLILYSNMISDNGASALAAVLPHMASLTDLDVKYNKLSDVGAQCLGASLRECKKIKTLRMWNQCIPYGVFERLQQQDSRILWH
ncbi:MHC class II transactivator isoform X2 [Corythoichthys intestinalis]|uniref:MHC class II transactivator isoform X2 n=1 Tax=Corythoichthys intestinalis TaxID=161448 RepID=UPI0025A5DE49|nr:MHC class II transactivator isoform X2 [Corythoichthys intestinalis]